MRYVGISYGRDIKSFLKTKGPEKEEDHVSIAQRGTEGQETLLHLHFSSLGMQLEKKRLQNTQRSLTLSCPHLRC